MLFFNFLLLQLLVSNSFQCLFQNSRCKIIRKLWVVRMMVTPQIGDRLMMWCVCFVWNRFVKDLRLWMGENYQPIWMSEIVKLLWYEGKVMNLRECVISIKLALPTLRTTDYFLSKCLMRNAFVNWSYVTKMNTYSCFSVMKSVSHQGSRWCNKKWG